MARHRKVRAQQPTGPQEAARVVRRDAKTQRFHGAMNGLTPRQKAFVRALVANGGRQRDAVREAGYTTRHPGSAARDLMANDRVVRAIHEERQRVISGDLANRAVSVLNGLLSDPETPAATRFQASKFALELAGHSVDGQQGRAEENLDRPLAEMTLEELEKIVRDSQRLRNLSPPEAQETSQGADDSGAVIDQEGEPLADSSALDDEGGHQ